jgi:His/Glu/Gln/Arg/opine family amino acid ABC transporter permease subunit
MGTSMIDGTIFTEYSGLILEGIQNTLIISASSCFFGFLLAIILALLEEYAGKVAKVCVQIYVSIFRGTPMLIQILGAYYLLPLIGIHFSGMMTAIIAISFNSGAYVSQVIRSGILAVSKAQIEAAYVLGFSKLQTARYIVIPQAIAIIFPSLSNELVTLVKDSSLASTIGVAELTKQGRIIISTTYDAISVFVLLALIYFLITSSISYVMYQIEKRLRIPC